jgi:hypothetical protein
MKAVFNRDATDSPPNPGLFNNHIRAIELKDDKANFACVCSWGDINLPRIFAAAGMHPDRQWDLPRKRPDDFTIPLSELPRAMDLLIGLQETPALKHHSQQFRFLQRVKEALEKAERDFAQSFTQGTESAVKVGHPLALR